MRTIINIAILAALFSSLNSFGSEAVDNAGYNTDGTSIEREQQDKELSKDDYDAGQYDAGTYQEDTYDVDFKEEEVKEEVDNAGYNNNNESIKRVEADKKWDAEQAEFDKPWNK